MIFLSHPFMSFALCNTEMEIAFAVLLFISAKLLPKINVLI